MLSFEFHKLKREFLWFVVDLLLAFEVRLEKCLSSKPGLLVFSLFSFCSVHVYGKIKLCMMATEDETSSEVA